MIYFIDTFQTLGNLPVWHADAVKRLVDRMKSHHTTLRFYPPGCEHIKTVRAHLLFYNIWFHKDFRLKKQNIFIPFWNCDTRQWEAVPISNLLLVSPNKKRCAL